MNSAIQIIMNNMIELGIIIISGIVTKVIVPEISRRIKASTESELLKSAMDEMQKTAESVVGYLEQTTVKQLKADGKWNTESQQDVICDAIEMMISDLSIRTTDFVEENGADIRDIVERYLESAIAKSHTEVK